MASISDSMPQDLRKGSTTSRNETRPAGLKPGGPGADRGAMQAKRATLLRILAALPHQTGCRVTTLPILLRRMPDADLDRLAFLVRAEVRAQREFGRVLRASRELQAAQ